MIKIGYPFLKKTIVTGFMLFTFMHLSFSQQAAISWAKQAGGNENDNCTDVFVAPDGNIYSSGNYSGNAQFGSFSLQASVGTVRGYISKSDANGTVLWAKNFGSGVSKIAAGPQGTLYVSGNFMGTENFGGISLTASGPNYDLYVLKINANGDVLWAKNFQGVSSNSIVSDASGNIYMGGTFALSATFGSITINQPAQVTTYDVYLAKLDPNGTPVWAQKYGGVNNDIFTSFDIDANGNVYVVGTFYNGTTIGTSTFLGYANIGVDIFLFKTDPNGGVIWAKQFGGGDIDGASAISVDNQGNAYITGSCRGAYQFGPFSAASINFGAYLCKINPAGTPLWLKSYLNHNQIDQSITLDVKVDHEGNVYSSGRCNEGYAFSGQHSIGDGEGYVLKSDSNGNVVWVKGIDNQSGNGVYGYALDTDLAGNVYMGGAFTGTIHTNPILQTNPNNFNYDIFLMKIGTCSVNAATTQNGNILTATATGASYQWVNCGNGSTPIAGATNQSFTATANGTYAVVVTQGGCSDTSSCVTVSVTVGLEDLAKDLFAIYPNPNAGIFKVVAESQVTVRINDATGKLVSTQTLAPGENIIELAHVKSGIYYITATDSNGQSIIRRISIIK